MTDFQAFILGLIQGLTEFLPVSSDGHLELANHIFHHSGGENFLFTIYVHIATVLSTIVVFRHEIVNLLKKGVSFHINQETVYLTKLLFSAIPVAILGLFFRKEVESLFNGNILLVGICLLITAGLLFLAHFYRGKSSKEISWWHSMVIGIAQALAVLPGLSRSGSTIATGILLGNKKEEITRFSFLMVLFPIMGAMFLDFIKAKPASGSGIGLLPLAIGFVTAFTTGLLACKWMIGMVNRGKLIYFAVYCSIVGLIAIFAA
jgi:undecaprenyl-diphosphatase